MTTNVLPLFWHLASSSKDTRLQASADLVASVEEFQKSFVPVGSTSGPSESSDDDEEDDQDEDEDDEEDDEGKDSDAESGVEVDGSDGEEDEETIRERKRAVKLDKELARDNSEDVVYCVKRLVRGLGSSRESSRLGFAVALTELLSRTPTVTPAQVTSLVIRNSQYGLGGKGSEDRDMMFARLFGLTSIVQSGNLYRQGASTIDFVEVISQLIKLGEVKAWLRESAWWGIIGALKGLLLSGVEWTDEAVEEVVQLVFGLDKSWSQEKVAVALLLQASKPELNWKDLLAPTFKHTPLLTGSNLVTLARILKETDSDDDEDAGASSSTGSWKPQLHFVWDIIFDQYFSESSTTSSDRPPFQDFFRTVVDESLFSNTSSPERKYWGFQVFQKALPLLPASQMPLIFTPNFMRSWINNLSSPDRYLHKIAQQIAKLVQDVVKSNPDSKVGFTLLSQLVGKHGRQDFDRVTKTKTVESIMGSLSGEGVGHYVDFLKSLILSKEDQASLDVVAIEERRLWAMDQLLALCRNGSIPKEDAWVSSVLDFLLVHGFFVIRKVDKKSNVSALQVIPKPAFSEGTAAACRARFFSCLVEVTTASTSTRDDPSRAARQQGSDASGKLWLRRSLELMTSLEGDRKHVEMMVDADEEIKAARKSATKTIGTLRLAKEQKEVARGVEVLLSFLVLQTYDDNEDGLDLLEETNSAAEALFQASKPTSEEEDAPIDTLLDTLVALLDKGSSDLRSLANLVVGMIAPAFTASSITHLVAQLEASVAAAAADADAEDGDDVDEAMDEDDDDEEVEEEDDEDEVESAEEEEEEDEDETAAVDPAFRQRVAEALGMNVDAEAGEEDEDSDEDEEVWDDEQMMKVDEQLAEVFRQQAGSTTKRADLKHLQIESLHFKNRILDFFDTYARRQPQNPLILTIIEPLLKLVRSTGISEAELANKAAGILRTRIGKAKEVPTTVDVATATTLLESIHEMARKASSADFSNLCGVCSIFVTRSLESSSESTSPVVEAYRKTLTDFMTRKSSLVHPNFILDFVRRFPLRAWPLHTDLCDYVAPGAGVNAYRQTQAYGMLQTLAQQLPTISKTIPSAEIKSFLSRAINDIYATFEAAASPSESSTWNAARLKEVAKFGLQLARISKATLKDANEISQVWDIAKLTHVESLFKEGEKTKDMKSVIGMIHQLSMVIGGKKDEKKKGKGKRALPDSEKMDVDDEVTESPVDAPKKKVKKSKDSLTNGIEPKEKTKKEKKEGKQGKEKKEKSKSKSKAL